MNYSIIIPTLNAGDEFSLLLKSIHEQQLDSYEILVIDSSSLDNTVTIARDARALVHVIPRKEFNHGTTRNLALGMTTGDIVVFLTQDVIFEKRNSLRTLLDAFADASCAAVYGRQLPHKGAGLFATCLRDFNYPDQSHVRNYADRIVLGFKATFLSDSFAAYRRNFLQEVGGFQNGILFAEDAHAAARLLRQGYSIHYCAESCVYHSHDYSMAQEFRRYFDIGVFHRVENHLIDEFGKPESHGARYVKKELSMILSKGFWWLMPVSIIRNALKFIGYRLGRNYNCIPRVLCRFLSMHSSWWT